MQEQFLELITAFLDEAGIKRTVTPGENPVSVSLGDMAFHIGLFESHRAIIMQAIAGVLPSSNGEAFCMELLRMNSLFRGTRGATLGLEGDAVTLQSFIPLDGLSKETFIARAVAFLEALLAVMEDFDNIARRSETEKTETLESDLLNMQNMLRI
ncbi:type III secretion system chaperone [Mailhella massiliensis]|uniref:Type III secretion system chaperone n=1 Tax=Mailhella massiliensis TaxID=1903261 RepID=A0A921AWT4_9BACT|nr:type III secretion system chaperone [Mailhella massiliensis]HJD97770.1 type III secretion system chaperone [Mailhella massiliensis]